MKIFKYLWRDKVSLILFIIAVLSVIGHFTKDLNMTPFLGGILALNIIFNINEQGRFFDRLYDLTVRFPMFNGILSLLGLPATNKVAKRALKEYHWMEIFVLGVLIGGSLLMLILLILGLVF